jgi:hypothetical protein
MPSFVEILRKGGGHVEIVMLSRHLVDIATDTAVGKARHERSDSYMFIKPQGHCKRARRRDDQVHASPDQALIPTALPATKRLR